MKRLFAAAAALALGSSAAYAANLPDYDAFYDSHRSVKVPGALSKQTEQLVKLGQIAHVEERLGVPTFFWANQDPNRASLRAVGLTPAEAARRHLFTYAELYRQTAKEMAEAPLKHVHDTGRGAIIATFTKKVNGTPIFRDEIHVIMDRDLNLVAITGYTTPHQATKDAKWNLSRSTAIATAFQDLTGQTALAEDFKELAQNPGGYHFFVQQGALAEGARHAERKVRVKDVLFSLPEGLVPAYYVEINAGRAGDTNAHFYSYVVSATDGRMLFRRNLGDSDSYTYKVWAETTGWHIPYDGPQGPPVNALGQVADATPHPTGLIDGYQAPFVPPNLVTVEANPFSRAATDFWLPSGATETTGNNVEAYADIGGQDGFDGPPDLRGVTSSPLTFDYTYDVTLSANANNTQKLAAITQLFFNNNFMHDWYYDHGFDELAGNAQTSNYGRGGEENDAIHAEAQDWSGANNANMYTPADGDNPIMQQYVFVSGDESKVEVTAPAAIAGTKVFGSASFGPPLFELTADVVYPLDSNNSHLGCGTFPAGSLTGKLAMIDRGTCSFAPKTTAAQAAGAIGVIMVNNNPNTGAPGMGNTVPPTPVNIPAVMLTLADGATIKQQIAASQTVTMHLKTFGRDGTIDNQIVAHEWAHYLSNRSIGNAAGLSNPQGRSMGEGWSDFNALVMTVRDADRGVASNANFGGVYATASYVEGGNAGTNQGAYFGIRRVPYSTDMSKNGLTFSMIEENVPLTPVNGNPSFPIAYGANGVGNSEFHASGEVWCTMLWEGFVGLLNATSRYTFTQAQDTMKDYFVASLQGTPNSPTFLEARDSLLAVVYASNKQDFALFTAGFAKRGAGAFAVAPDRYDPTHSGVIQSFASGGEAQPAFVTLDDNAAYCDHDGTLDNGETGNLILTVKNVGWTTLSQLTATVTSPTPGVTIGNNGVATFAANDPYTAVSAYVPVSVTGLTGPTIIELDIDYDDPSFAVAGPHSQTVQFFANKDETTATSANDDAESTKVAWTFDYDHNLYDGDQFQRVEFAVNDHAFWGPNPSAPAEIYMISPPLNVSATVPFSFTFTHLFNFEGGGGTYYDGGILEISTDGGQTWTKIPNTALAGQQYNHTLAAGKNPLQTQLAFAGSSTGFPNPTTTTVNLGTQYAGQTVQVRFSAGGDDNTAYDGWYIDDISFTGITNTPFSEVVADQAICVNRPPVAKVGPDQIVDERTAVVLDGSPSSDADGDPLTFTWTQTEGPAVTWTGTGTFTAPEVPADSQLTFLLTVSDGTLLGGPVATHVLVKQVNRKPTAVVPAPYTVEERTEVVLDGSKSFDVDGDALVKYQWTQVDGPSVTLSDTTASSPTFTAPEVMTDTSATFELVVSDGTLSSDPAELKVTFKQVNRAPMVSINPQDAVEERASVTLVGLANDPDGEDAPNLLYVWTQEAGPKAEVTADGANATFTAPEVKDDTPVTFKLTVFDGDEARADRLSGEAEITFTVKQVNRKPQAIAGTDREVGPGSVVGLGGATRDPDGDPMTFTWKQTEGTDVTLDRTNTQYTGFTVPANAEIGSKFSFELSVSDGVDTSTDTVTLTVASQPNQADSCGCSADGRGGVGGTSLLLVLGGLALVARRRRLA